MDITWVKDTIQMAKVTQCVNVEIPVTQLGELVARIEQLEEWERLFETWCVRALPLVNKEPLWPNPKWSQDVAMIAHALADRHS